MVKVLIVLNTRKDLLIEGIESYLSNQPGLLLEMTMVMSKQKLTQKFKECQPDVIVMFSDRASSQQEEMLKTLLSQKSDLRILLVSKEENSCLVLDRRNIQITAPGDFITSLHAPSTVTLDWPANHS